MYNIYIYINFVLYKSNILRRSIIIYDFAREEVHILKYYIYIYDIYIFFKKIKKLKTMKYDKIRYIILYAYMMY